MYCLQGPWVSVLHLSYDINMSLLLKPWSPTPIHAWVLSLVLWAFWEPVQGDGAVLSVLMFVERFVIAPPMLLDIPVHACTLYITWSLTYTDDLCSCLLCRSQCPTHIDIHAVQGEGGHSCPLTTWSWSEDHWIVCYLIYMHVTKLLWLWQLHKNWIVHFLR